MAEMMVGGEEDLGHESLTQERRLGPRRGTPGSIGLVKGHAFHSEIASELSEMIAQTDH